MDKKAFIKSLSSTANQIVDQARDPDAPSQIQGQINDASNRWKRVKNELDDLMFVCSCFAFHLKIDDWNFDREVYLFGLH